MAARARILERIDGAFSRLDERWLQAEPMAGIDQRFEHGIILAEGNQNLKMNQEAGKMMPRIVCKATGPALGDPHPSLGVSITLITGFGGSRLGNFRSDTSR